MFIVNWYANGKIISQGYWNHSSAIKLIETLEEEGDITWNLISTDAEGLTTLLQRGDCLCD